MAEHLYACEIPIDIVRFDPHADDGLYGKLEDRFRAASNEEIANEIGLGVPRVRALRDAMDHKEVRSISQLGAQKGVGVKTLESVIRYITTDAMTATAAVQESLEI